MNRIRYRRPFIAALAGLSGTLLAFLVVAPATLATQRPHAGPGFISPSPGMTYTVPIGGTPGTPLISPPPAVTHAVTTDGMPSWQITLITVAAALFAATIAVLLDRARVARKICTTTA